MLYLDPILTQYLGKWDMATQKEQVYHGKWYTRSLRYELRVPKLVFGIDSPVLEGL